MLYIKYWLLVFLVYFTHNLCFTQGYTVSVQEFGVEEGLLHRRVLSVFEDDEGLIWVGTSKGVQRYDGHEFKSWTKQSESGKIFEITTIGQDNAGWLWLWNNDLYEFVFLNPTTEQILTQEQRFGNDFPIYRAFGFKGWNYTSRHLFTDEKNRLFFVTSHPNQLIIFDAKTGFEQILLSGMSLGYLDLKLITSDGHLWVQENQENPKLHKFNFAGQLVESYDYPDAKYFNSFVDHLDGRISFHLSDSTKDRYEQIDKNGRISNLFSSPVVTEARMFYSNTGVFWYLGENGWGFYSSLREKPIFSLLNQYYSKQLFELISHHYEDSHGNIWLLGRWGLTRIKLSSSLFTRYFYFDEQTEKPINNSTRGIAAIQDKIYANFEFGGLVQMDKKEKEQWEIIDRNEDAKAYYGRPLIHSKKGKLLSGHPLQLRYIDLKENKVTATKIKGADAASNYEIWSILEDKKLTWLGMNNSLGYEDSLGVIHSIELHNKQSKQGTTITDIYHISTLGSDYLWLCSKSGLFLFDKKDHAIIEQYNDKNTETFFLPASTFYHLYIDKDSTYWLGTNEGLLRWDRKTNDKRLFTTIDGLSNNVIYAIFEDDYKNLWLSSDYGIMQFEKESHKVQSYLEKDGITHHEFNKTSFFKSDDGTIYFGGLNGITAFHPKDFFDKSNEQEFGVLLSSFEIFDGNKEDLVDKTGEVKTTKEIVFNPKDRFFRLKFTLPTMESPEKISYAWKVEDVDKDWNYQKSNSLQIGKLPYGKHILRIKGQSSGGQWSVRELKINIAVIRPFYLTYWFFSLVFLMLLIATWFYNRFRVLQFKKRQDLLKQKIADATVKIRSDKQIIEKQANELKQLDEMKSRFFANMSHELRTPLTLILGPLNSLLKKNNFTINQNQLIKTAQNSTKELLKLVGFILDLSKLEAGRIEVNEKPELLFNLVRRIIVGFESHAQLQGIRFSFLYEAEKNLKLLLDKDKLEIILNNLLSNAIKFTPPDEELIAKIYEQGSEIFIEVKDSGIGIHSDDLPHVFNRFYQSKKAIKETQKTLIDGGTGIGLSLSQEFAKLMGGKITVESQLGKGSTFTLQLARKEVFDQFFAEELSDDKPAETFFEEDTIFATAPKKTSTAEKPTLLLVEDNQNLREYIQNTLEPYYNIITAVNGQQAWNEMRTDNVCHLIISDIMMPIMDGYELLEKLKSDHKYRHIPVIMLTARAEIEDKLKALRIGVDDYMIKPFVEEELFTRIDNLLQNVKNRKEIDENKKVSNKQLFSEEDRHWLEQCEQILRKKIPVAGYNINSLVFDLGMSESTLSRQLKRMTGLTPARYFQEIRLNEARKYLESNQFNTVAQVAFAVGFSDATAFSRSFKKRFGQSPVELLNN